ncbi:MAG: hypothetical protein K0S11_341 [Gammaproteobacteria bacterium]|jgi:uncharacterized membrane protein YqjE|nr:hypothetical protein [Gammaproteobacteria bacterium]
MQQTASYENLSTALKELLLTFSQIIQEIVAIARLETRLAGISLFFMVLLLFTSSLLCFAIWLSLLLAAVFWLLQLGFSWPIVLLQLAGVNFLLLLFVGWAIKRCFRNLLFTATRKQLAANSLINQGQTS